MIKLNKGLVLDTRPLDQPVETYPYAKNGVSDRHNVRENEPGFTLSNVRTPYGTPIGVIETFKHPVLVSTNNVNSAFWYYDEVNDVLIPILDDANLSFKLGFTTAYYVTGTAQGNYVGDVVIAYTDKNGHHGYLNCDHPNVTSPEDLQLFPTATPPNIAITQVTGGSLLPGSYFGAVRYLRNDGTVTPFLRISEPTIVSGSPGQQQNVGLQFTLTNIDPTYNIVELAIISKVGGVFNQQLMADVQLVSPVTTITYTGDIPTTTITLDEVLKNPAVYDKIGTMGQLNDALYIGNLEAPPPVLMQQYASLVQVKWSSQLLPTFPADPRVLNGTLTGFMHREVYALYIQYSLAEGGWTNVFHIPGLDLVPGDLTPSANASTGGMGANIPLFQVEDTIPDFDPVSFTGHMGKWQNATETYPDTPDYDSSAVGGRNLRGKPVLHHRFPSIRWCKQNLYAFNPDYGRGSLDVLGLQISNVVIPSQYASRITGYRILYAQRDSGNSTVIAQSQYLCGGRSWAAAGRQYDPINQAPAGAFNNFIFSGGNWFSEDDRSGGNIYPVYPDHRICRFHAFDLLLNQPAVSPSYIVNELKMEITQLNLDRSFIEDGDVFASNDGPIVLLLDYLSHANTPTASTGDKLLRPVTASTYAPNNLINGNWNNIQLETCLGLTLGGPEILHMGTPPNSNNNPADDPTTEFSYMKLILHVSAEPSGSIPQWEWTFLSNLMFLRGDLYDSFASQNLVIANSGVVGNGPAMINSGGDVHICDYTFHTYGWIDANNDSYTGINDPKNGMRVARRMSCEAASNINLRFVQVGNQYSDYYPKNPLVKNDVTNYLTLFLRTADPNQFGYTKDFNTLNNLVTAAIFSPFADQVYKFPYRIARGGFLDPLDKRRNWRTWDPLDFYELEKDFGIPIFLGGLDDRLLILCQKALFVTQDKTKLESDVIAVTLGAGDIFQFPPQPGLSSKLGYAGSQSDLACLITPQGFVFVDMAQGQIFQWKGGLKLLNEGANIFLRDALRVTGNNIYIGNGVMLAYDPYYKRILLTVKNQMLASASTTPPLPYQSTQAFINTLTPGVSIVIKDGRLQRFLGVNANPAYMCKPDPIPVVQNYTILIPDNTPIGTQILQVAGVNVDDFYITGGNTLTAFSLDAPTGKLAVAGPLNYHKQASYVLQCSATNDEGFSSTFTITVNLTATIRPPVTGNQTVSIPERSPVGTAVATVQATDPQGLPLTYAIAAGNTNNAFAIDASGNITVLTPSALNYLTNPTFILTVAVSNGTYTTDGQITVNLLFVNQPPSASDVVVSIHDTTPNGTQIVDLSTAVVDEGVLAGLQKLTFTVVADPSGGAFGITPAGIVTVANNTFNPPTTPTQYIIQIRATDNATPPLSSLFRLIINILYDPAEISFAPASGTCVGGTCPAGYVLSPDGSQCQKTISIDATPPSGAQIQVAPAVNGAYSDFGALIYAPGYSSNGVGTISIQLNSTPWNNPSDNLFDGPLNRAGVWGATPVPDNQPIGFSVPFVVPVADTYYVAIAGDNAGEITVDGNVIITQDPTAMGISIGTQLPVYAGQGISVAFKFWHVYPVMLQAGTHYIGVQGINFGGAAGFAAEIYENTEPQLAAAQLDPSYVANPASFPRTANHYTNLNLIFSTRWTQYGYFTSGINNAYTCPVGYGLDPTKTPPQCVEILSIPATQNVKQWGQVQVKKGSTVIATFNNQLSPQQYFQGSSLSDGGIPVPYYPPVPNHVDCSGTVQTFLNALKQQAAIKNNCSNPAQAGSTVIYSVQPGRYMSVVSQADADSQAQTDATSNAQTYANNNGTCT